MMSHPGITKIHAHTLTHAHTFTEGGNEGLIASRRRRSNLICAIRIPPVVTTPKRRTYYCSVCVCDAVGKIILYVALRNGKRLQCVYNVRERDKNKTRRRGARCYSAVLISLIPTLWCSVPR